MIKTAKCMDKKAFNISDRVFKGTIICAAHTGLICLGLKLSHFLPLVLFSSLDVFFNFEIKLIKLMIPQITNLFTEKNSEKSIFM